MRPPIGVAATDEAFEDRIVVSWTDDSRTEHGYVVGRRESDAALSITDVALVDTLGSGACVAVSGKYAYVGNASGSFRVIDICTPDSAHIAGSCTLPDSVLDIAAFEDYAYVVTGTDVLLVIDVSVPEAPELVHSLELPGSPMSIAIAGDRAYVGKMWGLEVLDISSPRNPVSLGEEFAGESPAVAVHGNYVCAASDAGLFVFDVASFDMPSVIAVIPLESGVSEIVMNGACAVIAPENEVGLRVIDISDPRLPVVAGSIATAGEARDLALAGNYVYAAEASAVEVFDVSSPARPVLLESHQAPGATGIAVVGDYIYLAGTEASLQVLSQGTLTYLGPNWTSYTDRTAVSGISYAYRVAAFDSLGEGVGFSLPAEDGGKRVLLAPSSVDADKGESETEVAIRWRDNSDAEEGYRIYRDAQLAGTVPDNATAFVDDEAGFGRTHSYSVAAFDDYGESEAKSDSGNTTVFAPVSVNASDSYGDDRIEVTWIDRSQAEDGYRVYRDDELIATLAPGMGHYQDGHLASGIVGSYDSPGHARDAFVSGDLAFIADQSQGLQVVDIHDPANPVRIGYCATPFGYARGVWVSDGIAYLADLGLQSIDVHDPVRPVIIGDYSLPDAFDVCVSDTVAFLATGRGTFGGLRAVSVSDPANPVEIGHIETLDFARRVCVAGNIAFVADSTGLEIIDVSHPDDMVIIRHAPYAANDVVVADGLAYLAVNGVGLQILELTDPADPTLIGTYETPGRAVGVSVFDGVAFVACDSSGLQVVDVRDPYNPKNAGAFALSDEALNVSGYGDHAYVAADDAGLVLVRYSLSAEELRAGVPYRYCVRARRGGDESDEECDSGIVSEGTVHPADTRLFEVVASDGLEYDRFGMSVASGGNVAVIGAPGDDPGGHSNAGSAYVFRRDSRRNWVQEATLTADNPQPNDNFGSTAAVSGDLAIIDAHYDDEGGAEAGAAYIFRRNGTGNWVQEDKLLADDRAAGDEFGHCVAISGNLAAVGAWKDDGPVPSADCGAAYVFQRDGSGSWIQTAKLLASDGAAQDNFGNSVAISGDVAIVGAYHADTLGTDRGAAYIFERDGSVWAEKVKLLASDGAALDNFGNSVAISGDLALVAAAGDDDERGIDCGSVYVFRRDGSGTWVEEEKLLASDGAAGDVFGVSVAVSGDEAVIGAQGHGVAGSAYMFRRDVSGSWRQEKELVPADGGAGDLFGNVVAVSEGVAVIGAYKHGRPPTELETGAAYMLALDTSVDASDGTFPGQISVAWIDNVTNETGFRIYRDGVLRGQVPAGVQVFYDVADPAPARAYEYSVAALVDTNEVSLGCDLGWRPPDGEIRGRVATIGGGGVAGIDVCLTPPSARSLHFDGAGGSGRIEDDGVFNFAASAPFTVEAWVKYTGGGGTSGVHGTILAKTGTANRYPFLLRNDRGNRSPGRLVFSVSDGAPAPVSVMSARNDLNDGAWVHVACVHDPAGQVRLYVNGALDGSVSSAGLGQITNDDDLFLGASALGLFEGQIDEVRIWDVARDSLAIVTGMTAPLGGDEPHLVGYWPFDGQGERAAAGMVSGSPYCLLEGGAYISDDVAPLDACALTDAQGTYGLTGILYGDYQVRPSGGNRQFDPPMIRVALNAASPVENQVNFTDISSFTVSGRILYAGTECPAADIPILVDGEVSGTTDSKGKFAVAVGLGEHGIRPELTDHFFAPESLLVMAEADIAGLSFADSAAYRLHGRVGGGCGRAIGDVAISIRSEDGCLESVFPLASGDSTYSIQLPPRKYFVSAQVDPSSIPQGLVKTDVVRFFQNLGVRSADMDSLDAEMDFVYRAPLALKITGLEQYVETCDGPLMFGGRALPDSLPVIPQLTKVILTVTAEEVYGDNETCPLDSGRVTIYDELFDRQNEPFDLEIRDGNAVCTTFTSTPSLVVGRVDERGEDRSLQKAFSAVVESEGRPAVTATAWALVTGHVAPPGADFVTGSLDVPLYILRDPPGDGSYAYLEEGTAIRKTTDWSRSTHTVEGGLTLQVWNGIKQSFFVGLGAGVIENIEGTIQQIDSELLAGCKIETENRTDITCTMKERFSTSASETFVGGPGDIYIGAGWNFLFSEVNVIDVRECSVRKSVSIGFEPESLKTIYTYTEQYINSTLIPELDSKADYYQGRAEEDSAAAFRRKAAEWRYLLFQNDSLKTDAEPVTPDGNRSFSAGADFASSHISETSQSYRHVLTALVDEDIEWGGVGLSMKWFALQVGLHAKNQNEWIDDAAVDPTDTTATHLQEVHYVLSDNDIGDHFTVDIKNDGRYPCPVFAVRAGASSCPYEPGLDTTGVIRMLPRDAPRLSIAGPHEQNDVPPDEPAVFALALSNLSPTNESRLYALRLLTTSNPNGAVGKVGGVVLSNGVEYFIDGGQTQEATLTVERGPTRYRYQDLKLLLYPPCEYAFWEQGAPLQQADTLVFSVAFDAPCSDVALALPQPGWIYTKADHDSGRPLEIWLADYELNIDEDTWLQDVGLEYRWLGSGDVGPSEWIAIPADSVGAVETGIAWLPDPGLMDGTYELRAYTFCGTGRAFSAVSTGTLERHGPQVLGTPEPSDGELSFGEDIRIIFNEPIDGRSVGPANIALRYLDGPDSSMAIAIETVCGERTITISPTIAASELEGRRIEAQVSGLTDLAGNPMAGTITWSFCFRKSRFTWSDLHLQAEVPYRHPGEVVAELVNGTGESVDFAIGELPGWIEYAKPPTGTIAPGGKRAIHFSLLPDIPEGAYETEVRATAGGGQQGTAIFDLEVTVACRKPSWTIDASGFEHTMTMVATLNVNGTISNDGDDWVAAFVGNQLRGLASPVEVPVGTPPYPYLAFLTIHGNRPQGETVRFRIWDQDSCMTYNASPSCPFIANEMLGDPQNPFALTTMGSAGENSLTIPVAGGWSWISTNIRSADMSVTALLSNLTPAPGDVFKSDSAFVQFIHDSTGWSDNAFPVDNASAYMMRLAAPGTIIHDGSLAPIHTPVPVRHGWNWIGYIPEHPQEVTQALADLEALGWLQAGDVVKSQTGFAEYADGAWYGSLDSMRTGSGYKLYLSSEVDGSFTYPAALLRGPIDMATGHPPTDSAAGRPAAADRNLESLPSGLDLGMPGPPAWTVNPHAYQHTMTLTGVLSFRDGESIDAGDLVGAFVGAECRGLAHPVSVAGAGRHEVFLLVFSNDASGEQVVLRAYDADEGILYDIVEPLTFEADKMAGTLAAPMRLTAGQEWNGDLIPRRFALGQSYPNPSSPWAVIAYEIPAGGGRVTIRIYDVAGRLVRTLVNDFEREGTKKAIWDGLTDRGEVASTGIYFFRMTAPGFEKTNKVAITR